MNKDFKISYIKHGSVDSGKWNLCISNAANSRFYANVWHLDRTAVYWDALVYNNYEYVMPLPVRRKWGITYVFQPLYCQQLGIFPNPPEEIADLFYKTLTKKFRYTDTQLNAGNHIGISKKYSVLPRLNYLLHLEIGYDKLAKNYSKNAKRNLSRANEGNLQMIAGISLEEFLLFKSENLPEKSHKEETAKLKSVIAYGQYKGFGKIYGVYNPENQLCAAVYFCRWKDRVIYLNAVTSTEGKELGAMYFLVDNFIRENAGQNLVIDFEGSMIEGVARFYAGFGANAETYHHLKINRLPFWLKWVKR